MNKRLWKGFWQVADLKSWIASTVPMFVAAALAYAHAGSIHPGWFALVIAGIYLIEIGKNAVNEFVDYETGVDRAITSEKRNPYSGGKKTIVDGLLSTTETKIIALATLGAAFAIGCIIALIKEPQVLWIGITGLLLAVFYSLPPFRLNYSGFGEAAVGLCFGPLLVAGVYLVLAGQLRGLVFLAGLPLAFLITAILWINQYPDYEADIAGGKRNWLVRLGKKAGLKVYAGLYAGAYLSVLLLAAADKNGYWLLALLSLPLAAKSVQTAARYMDAGAEFLKANANALQVYVISGLAMIIAALLGG